jgi:ferrous iron transport protein B
MIMGFGCSVPAMINTRTLADEKEKLATVRVIPFFSCGAKLPILTAISGGIVAYFNVGNVDLITYGMYLLGMITALVAVIIMRETSLKGDTPPFIMELPAYHKPEFRNLMMLLWDKAKHFIQKAFTIILASTIVIWVISHFDFGWHYLTDDQMQNSILGGIGQLIQPLFTPLGFGSQLQAFGWVFAVAAITGLIAKENVVSTLGALAACLMSGMLFDIETDGGVGAVSVLIEKTLISLPALLSFIAFNMTTIPCFAAVAAAKGEMPNKKTFRFTLLFWIVTSYIVSSAVYLIGTYWWTLFIYLAVAVVVFFAIRAYNKKRFAKGK